LKKLVFALIVLIAPLIAAPAAAQAPLDGYVARIGPQDHFNSNGVRLDNAAAIIRQDRANLYRFGKADPEDEPDSFFGSPENRALMEQMLRAGATAPSAERAIVNGTPLISVQIFPNYVLVTVISD
jgi:hypothetical protein